MRDGVGAKRRDLYKEYRWKVQVGQRGKKETGRECGAS